jgi:hypothetical protein
MIILSLGQWQRKVQSGPQDPPIIAPLSTDLRHMPFRFQTQHGTFIAFSDHRETTLTASKTLVTRTTVATADEKVRGHFHGKKSSKSSPRRIPDQSPGQAPGSGSACVSWIPRSSRGMTRTGNLRLFASSSTLKQESPSRSA